MTFTINLLWRDIYVHLTSCYGCITGI